MGKFIRKTALLLLVLLTLAVAAGPVLTPNWNTGDSCFGKTTKAYLAQPEDAISVVTIGSSQVLRGIDTAAMAEDYGIDAYCRATAVQAPAVTYYYTREVIEHHNVKVILADFSFLYDSYDPDEYEPYVRYAFDYMPLSPHTQKFAPRLGSEKFKSGGYLQRKAWRRRPGGFPPRCLWRRPPARCSRRTGPSPAAAAGPPALPPDSRR